MSPEEKDLLESCSYDELEEMSMAKKPYGVSKRDHLINTRDILLEMKRRNDAQ